MLMVESSPDREEIFSCNPIMIAPPVRGVFRDTLK